MRGRIPWFRRKRTNTGEWAVLKHEDAEKHINELQHRKPVEHIDYASIKALLASDKISRFKTAAFKKATNQGTKNRSNVGARKERIEDIAKAIEKNGWQKKSNSWIASRLPKDPKFAHRELSAHTIRQDVSHAKKLTGNEEQKNK